MEKLGIAIPNNESDRAGRERQSMAQNGPTAGDPEADDAKAVFDPALHYKPPEIIQ